MMTYQIPPAREGPPVRKILIAFALSTVLLLGGLADGVARAGKTGGRGRPPTSPGGTPKGKGYASGGGPYDTDAAAAQRREESRQTYQKGQQPRTTYTDSAGTPRPIDPRDREVQVLREQLDHERW